MKDMHIDIGAEADPADLAERIGQALRRETELEAGRIRAALNEVRLALDARLRSRVPDEAAGRARIDA